MVLSLTFINKLISLCPSRASLFSFSLSLKLSSWIVFSFEGKTTCFGPFFTKKIVMRLLLCLLFLLALATSSSATYCLCRDGVGENELQTSIDYACGVLKDCNPIHDKGPCYQPNTVKSHCDWAVNTYFQRSGQISGSCNFSGTATTSPNPPSTVVTGCIYPSSPGSAGTTPTTGTTSGTQTFPGTPVFGPTGAFDPSGNNGASSLFISIALTLGFSVIAFL